VVVTRYGCQAEINAWHINKQIRQSPYMHGVKAFTLPQSKLTDDYFLKSSADIGFFFEEKAFDKDGNLVQPKNLCINKIGHGKQRKFLYTPSLSACLVRHSHLCMVCHTSSRPVMSVACACVLHMDALLMHGCALAQACLSRTP
jgi:hypothetical protein